MSVPDRRVRRNRKERSSLQVLEESFHLLRSVDVKFFWIYFVGTIPFVVGLLYFVADMSRSSHAGRDAVIASIVMVGLYFWMRSCQAKFCVGLWETLNPEGVSEMAKGKSFENLAALWVIQAFQLPLLLIGFFFAIPLGWIIAMLQNATVLARTRDFEGSPLKGLIKTSLKLSHYEWAQNHGIILVLCVVGFFTWINVVATCVMVPSFAKSFFGIESIFTLSPMMAVLNTTFLLGSLLLTYLVISPMMKAVYTLRCFYAESRETGEDLLSRLAGCRERRARQNLNRGLRDRAKVALIGSAILLGLFSSGPIEAAEDESVANFREELSETMEQKKYQWQLSRRNSELGESSDDSWLSKRMREIADSTRETMKSIGDWIKVMMDRMESGNRSPGGSSNSSWDVLKGLSSSFSVGLIVLVSALIGWLAWVAYRRYKGRPSEVDAGEVRVEAIDLRREDIVATQLPEGEWMQLAREQLSNGDRRLAVRALFLATLANLGERGVLRIARSKSNRDYRGELELRVRKHVQLREAFDRNTILFEEAWYGWHPVDVEMVDRFLKNHEMIAKESGVALTGPVPVSEGML
tara:strand:+ start:7605 stop:9344 length:1740 start_codon:yes stop_codon:yes gene_type:complete